jgi:hypothetical protein
MVVWHLPAVAAASATEVASRARKGIKTIGERGGGGPEERAGSIPSGYNGGWLMTY